MGDSAACIHFLGDQHGAAHTVIHQVVQHNRWSLHSHDNAEAFLKALRHQCPGVLSVAPGRTLLPAALDMTAELRRRRVLFPVLLIGRDDDAWDLEVAAVHRGAFSALRLPRDKERVGAALARAIEHDQLGEPSQADVRQRLASLSPREREVLDLTLQGSTTDEMASLLGVCYQTVNKHRARIRTKMRVKCDLTLANILHIQPPHHRLFDLTHPSCSRPIVAPPPLTSPTDTGNAAITVPQRR